ncbi:beta-1,4-glucuronyltransferase 1 [Grus japonensis]|uniref:Beta-1,4-glucuronyltransferase 1 n=1 Tax=Grus japonensis TaxID=30415 RepID=A0ABC9XW61_GRUJA
MWDIFIALDQGMETHHNLMSSTDPGVLNALEVPNRLSVPSIPGVSNIPGVPNTVSIVGVPNNLEVPNVLSDPGVPKTLEVPKSFHDPGVPNALRDPNTLKDPNALENLNSPGATTPSWDQVVFVLPAFEVRAGTRVPGTKAELLQLWDRGDARPFYGALCPRCQAPTSYGRWWALPPTAHLRVAYEMPWRDPWEPFYVAPARGVPPFDERFLQYGFNRISQACELHVAGFRFVVLDGAFVVHRGFKEAGGFHGGREAELHRNRQLFRHFRAELRQRYPRSSRRC